MKEVKVASSSVLSHLEDTLGQLPSWSDTVGTMEKLFGLIDMVVFSLFRDETDDLGGSVLSGLEEKFGGAF